MKVTLEEHGGWAAGMHRSPYTVDSDTLPKLEADELIRLTQAVMHASPVENEGPGPYRDAQTYSITIEDGSGRTNVQQSDGRMTAEFAALVKLVRQPACKK